MFREIAVLNEEWSLITTNLVYQRGGGRGRGGSYFQHVRKSVNFFFVILKLDHPFGMWSDEVSLYRHFAVGDPIPYRSIDDILFFCIF